ncbi:FecR family protein [Pedobacter sp.]|jgi:transmembrane sensor|uniref:FecR family protein n=1 Tax=Pedobacter sp. TaxID=1411316 RepID=UPI002C77D4CB|nr:FecR domain-containing protein [Pedobacter sp.]HWW39479.1 FecR domain-containing protein [Pedobacter sp.]
MKKKYKNDLERIDAAWKKLEPLLEEDIQIQPERKFTLFSPKLLAAAAVLLLVAAAGILFLKDYHRMISYTTKYGETARIVLPDSSVVLLNGNTRLSFRKHWSSSGDREVNMDGEAYFSVKHTKTDQKFFVRMNDHSSVQVLGTEFNVSKRKEETRVVLNSGKIALRMETADPAREKVITMKPGDLVEYQPAQHTYIKKVVDPEMYSSWKSSRLVFEKTRLKEVLQQLHNTYGLNIQVEKPELMNMSVSGSAPTQNIDLLIKGLSEIFHLELIRKGDTLIVTSN